LLNEHDLGIYVLFCVFNVPWVSLSDSVFTYPQSGGDFGIKQDNFMAHRRATTAQFLLTLRVEVERFRIRPKVEKEGSNHNSIACYKQLSTVHLQQHNQLKIALHCTPATT
jgi:hypothetical protein